MSWGYGTTEVGRVFFGEGDEDDVDHDDGHDGVDGSDGDCRDDDYINQLMVTIWVGGYARKGRVGGVERQRWVEFFARAMRT